MTAPRKWSDADDEEITRLALQRYSDRAIAGVTKRKVAAVSARLQFLEIRHREPPDANDEAPVLDRKPIALATKRPCIRCRQLFRPDHRLNFQCKNCQRVIAEISRGV